MSFVAQKLYTVKSKVPMSFLRLVLIYSFFPLERVLRVRVCKLSTLHEKATFAKLNFRSHEGIKSVLFRDGGSKSNSGRRINAYRKDCKLCGISSYSLAAYPRTTRI